MFLPRPDRHIKGIDDKIAEISQVLSDMPNDKKCLLQAKLFNLKLKKQRLAALSRLSLTQPVEQGFVSELDMMIAETDIDIDIEAIRTSKKYRRTERRRRERMILGPYNRVDRVQNHTATKEHPGCTSSSEAMENIHLDLENLQHGLGITNVNKKPMCDKSTSTETVIVLSADSSIKTVPFKKRITSSMTPEPLSPTGEGAFNPKLSSPKSSCSEMKLAANEIVSIRHDNVSSIQDSMSVINPTEGMISPTELFTTAQEIASSTKITSPKNQNTSLNTFESVQSLWFENSFDINSSVGENLLQIVEQKDVSDSLIGNKNTNTETSGLVIDKVNANKSEGKNKSSKDIKRDSTNLQGKITSSKKKSEKRQQKCRKSRKVASNVEQNVSKNGRTVDIPQKENLNRVELHNKDITEISSNTTEQNMTNSTEISKELAIDKKVSETTSPIQRTHTQIVNLYNTYQEIYSCGTSKVNADISKDSNNQDITRSSDKHKCSTDQKAIEIQPETKKRSMSSKVVIPQNLIQNDGTSINNKENQPCSSKETDHSMRDTAQIFHASKYTENKQRHLSNSKSSQKSSQSVTSENKKCDHKSMKKSLIDKCSRKTKHHKIRSQKHNQSSLEQTSERASTTQDSLYSEKCLENGQISKFNIREMLKQAVELKAISSISQEEIVNDLFRDLMASKRYLFGTDSSSDNTASCRECGSVSEGHMCAYTLREILEQC